MLRLSTFRTDVNSAAPAVFAAITTQTAAYTLQQTDHNTVILVNSSSGVTLTLPSGLTVGTAVEVIQSGSGQVTFAAGSGATLLVFGTTSKTAGVNASARVRVIAANTWNLAGNVQ